MSLLLMQVNECYVLLELSVLTLSFLLLGLSMETLSF
jgi:hypothetical protein